MLTKNIFCDVTYLSDFLSLSFSTLGRSLASESDNLCRKALPSEYLLLLTLICRRGGESLLLYLQQTHVHVKNNRLLIYFRLCDM